MLFIKGLNDLARWARGARRFAQSRRAYEVETHGLHNGRRVRERLKQRLNGGAGTVECSMIYREARPATLRKAAETVREA